MEIEINFFTKKAWFWFSLLWFHIEVIPLKSTGLHVYNTGMRVESSPYLTGMERVGRGQSGGGRIPQMLHAHSNSAPEVPVSESQFHQFTTYQLIPENGKSCTADLSLTSNSRIFKNQIWVSKWANRHCGTLIQSPLKKYDALLYRLKDPQRCWVPSAFHEIALPRQGSGLLTVILSFLVVTIHFLNLFQFSYVKLRKCV